MHQEKNRKDEHGQILVLLAAALIVLLLFVGLSIDYGLAYITKTTLSKGVDAAALTAMRNFNKQGQAAAEIEGQSAFSANFQALGGPSLGTPPTLTWNWPSPYTTLTVSAQTTINTYFIRVLGSQYDTLTVNASATSTLTPLIMALVLDRSGSMNYNGGAAALPTAVTDFINNFSGSTTNNNVAEISFASNVTTDVPMTTSFVSPIDSSVDNMQFNGGTFAQGGLQYGLNAINGVTGLTNPLKVLVFFTDGWANTNNDNLHCGGGGGTTNLNYGGCAPTEAKIGWCGDPADDIMFFMDPTTGNTTSCFNATTFPVEAPGVSNALTQQNVTLDATYRTEQLANTMRNESGDDITIYSIGLGSLINQTYLETLANDPAYPSTYNSSQTAGVAVFAPDASQLDAVFETIAQKITLRLSQ